MVRRLSTLGAVNYPFKVVVDDTDLCNSFKISVLQNGVTLAVRAKRSRPESMAATYKPCH